MLESRIAFLVGIGDNIIITTSATKSLIKKVIYLKNSV